jgi:protein-S-isoprenylcysteine O-methyltransferase Ste14
VALVVPFLLVARFQPFGMNVFLPLPYLQVPLGLILFLVGLVLLVETIHLFAQVGQGTLAPWDPPRQLVVRGVYRYVRNPMISGVLFMLLGEAVLLGSAALLAWFLLALVINTMYFKLSEEPELVRRFGQEYITYRANVPMWIPRTRPWDPGV